MESNYELKYQLNIACYIFNDIIKIEDFDLDNVLIDEESIENILVFKISFKCLIDSKRLRISSIKWMNLLGFMMELDILYCMEVKNMATFTTSLDV